MIPASVPLPPRDELRAYRDRTVALLRRYFMLSIETGRLPSILGREFFRAKCSSYRLVTFEDVVVFVHDIERCLERLPKLTQQVIAKTVLQDHTFEEAAYVLHRGRMTIIRHYEDGLDDLAEIFLQKGLMTLLPRHEENPVKPPALCKSPQVIATTG